MKTAAYTALLVIGYGNPIREDDAAGPLVAGQVEALGLPGVRTLTCHQLLPEMAEEIANALAVVFVDAAATPALEVRLQPLSADPSAQLMTHAPGPAKLLALAREVCGEAPPAWLLTIPARSFGYADVPTPTVQQGIDEAVRTIRMLAAEWTF